MYRLRIGHAGVNKYLYKIGLKNSPLCTGCGVEETVAHYIMQCTRFVVQRNELWHSCKKIGVTDVNLKTLLGGEEKYAHLNFRIIGLLLKYVSSTGKLNEI